MRNTVGFYILVVVSITCTKVQGFGSGGLVEFCFDDLDGIAATGIRTCLEVKRQGHCQTESYSKYCHMTCLVCTSAPTGHPTRLPTNHPTRVPTKTPTTKQPTKAPCKDDEAGLTRMLIRGGKKDMTGLEHPCDSIKSSKFCQTHTVLSKKYCSKTCGLCRGKCIPGSWTLNLKDAYMPRGNPRSVRTNYINGTSCDTFTIIDNGRIEKSTGYDCGGFSPSYAVAMNGKWAYDLSCANQKWSFDDKPVFSDVTPMKHASSCGIFNLGSQITGSSKLAGHTGWCQSTGGWPSCNVKTVSACAALCHGISDCAGFNYYPVGAGGGSKSGECYILGNSKGTIEVHADGGHGDYYTGICKSGATSPTAFSMAS